MLSSLPSEYQPLLLSKDFRNILDYLENSDINIFVTGKAGTGKSTLLNIFRKTTRKKVVFLAPTGIAALNIRGQTIHSFFSIPPKLIKSEEIDKIKNQSLIRKLDTIVIDEISMVRADIIDHINHILQRVRKNTTLFGGVQIVLFGDMFQLPPIVAGSFEKEYFKTFYSSPYFFSASCMEGMPFFETYELRQVFRQSEQFFIQLLENIRRDDADEQTFTILNERVRDSDDIKRGEIVLTSINAIADTLNVKKLKEIDSPSTVYQAQLIGEFNRTLSPTDEFLVLKKGAQVMFLKNDPARRFVNGTIGEISSLNKNSINVIVKDTSGTEHEVEVQPFSWDVIRYTYDKEKEIIRSEIAGSFIQLPVKLSWAITIHKSQGKTFEKVYIDLGRGAFEFGQCYVALSRCKTLDGISLKSPLKPSDVMADPRIIEFYEIYFSK